MRECQSEPTRLDSAIHHLCQPPSKAVPVEVTVAELGLRGRGGIGILFMTMPIVALSPGATEIAAGAFILDDEEGAHFQAAPISAVIAWCRWRRGLRRFTRLAIHSRPSRFGIQIHPPKTKNGSPLGRSR
jgi:hypothetical protein